MKRLLMFFFIAISAFLATNADAQISIRKLTNATGSAVAANKVVVASTTTASAFTTTATADANKVLGVTSAAVNNGAVGTLVVAGVGEVVCVGAVAIGDYIGTSSTAGSAESNGAEAAGSFAIALEAGTDTTITCIIIGQTGVSTSVSPSSISLPDGDATIVQGTDNDIRFGYDELTDDRWEMNDGTNLLIYVKDQGTEGDLGITGDLYIQDDDVLRFGNDSDIRVGYDETTDDRLEFNDGTNLLAYLTDAGTEGNFGVTGDILIQDDDALRLGTDSDIYIGYDETTDDRLEISDGTNLLLAVKDNANEGDLYITGDEYIQDDDLLRFGTDSDIRFTYDETTDDRLEVSDGTNLLFSIADGGTTGNVSVTGTFTTSAFVGTGTFSATGGSIQLGDAYADILTIAASPIFEGADDDLYETAFDFASLTADRNITFRNASGTVILSGDTFTGDVTATLDTDGSTSLTVASGAITAAKTSITGTPNGTKFLRDDWSWQATSGGSTTLNDLSDVVITAAASGDLLLYSGTEWADIAMSGDATINGSGALTIAADAVALTTDTSGNYVANVANGSGITGGSAGSEGAALTLALGALTADWNQTGAFDIALNSASSELKILESAGATYYGIFDVTDLGADRTYTFPNVSGTVITTGDTATVTDTVAANDLTINSSALISSTAAGTNSFGSNTGATNTYIKLNAAANKEVGIELDAAGTAEWYVYTPASSSDLRFSAGATNVVSINSAGDLSLLTANSELKILESTGATYYGVLDVADLDAERTYTLPNVSGTVITTGDTATVTSAMISTDIANADISASAAIAESKLNIERIVWLSGGAIWPASSGGCSAGALDANNNVKATFAASKTGYFCVCVPSNYDGSTENIVLYWSKGDTNAVSWTVNTVIIADNGDLASSTTTSTNTWTETPATTNYLNADSETDADFFGTSSNAGKWCRIVVSSNAFTGADANLVGIKVEY